MAPFQFSVAVLMQLFFVSAFFLLEAPNSKADGPYCDDLGMRLAVTELLAGDGDTATKVCMSQGKSWAFYMKGIYPLFHDVGDGNKAKYRHALEAAADQGFPRAQAMIGSFLYDNSNDKDRALQLINESARAGDPWGIYLSATLGPGNGLISVDQADILHSATKLGFPFSHSLLAIVELSQISEEGSTTLHATKARELLAVGAVFGDPVAVSVLKSEREAQGYPSDGLYALYLVLYSLRQSEQDIDLAYETWSVMVNASSPRIDIESLGIISLSTRTCDLAALSNVQKLCKIRAVMDHYMCSDPTKAEMMSDQPGDRIWMRSSGYETCRLLRLQQPVNAFYYK